MSSPGAAASFPGYRLQREKTGALHLIAVSPRSFGFFVLGQQCAASATAVDVLVAIPRLTPTYALRACVRALASMLPLQSPPLVEKVGYLESDRVVSRCSYVGGFDSTLSGGTIAASKKSWRPPTTTIIVSLLSLAELEFSIKRADLRAWLVEVASQPSHRLCPPATLGYSTPGRWFAEIDQVKRRTTNEPCSMARPTIHGPYQTPQPAAHRTAECMYVFIH